MHHAAEGAGSSSVNDDQRSSSVDGVSMSHGDGSFSVIPRCLAALADGFGGYLVGRVRL